MSLVRALGTLSLLTLTFVACGGSSAGNDAPVVDSGPSIDDAGADVADTTPLPPQTLTVDSVSVLQGVTVPIVRAGELVLDTDRLAPVVVGREALVRVFAQPGPGWKLRNVIGRLELTTKGKPVWSLEVTRRLGTSKYDEGKLESTWNFDVPAGTLAATTSFSVSFRDADTRYARFPEGDAVTPLAALGSGEQLTVRIVPVRLDGRLPDVSSEALKLYQDTLYALYPTTKVVVDVRTEPYDWTSEVTADGNGWGELLDAVVTLRQTDAVADNVYYYAAFKPADSLWKYCGAGCVLGLSGLITNPSDAFGRASIGVGFGDDQSAETLAHELGHAHGRAHAPCGPVAGPDTKFPYARGGIGSYGWDVLQHVLVSPADATDMMGYCNPTWISDYNFGKIAVRMRAVKDRPSTMSHTTPVTYRFVRVAGDGSMTWGRTVTTRTTVAGEPVSLSVRDASGAETKAVAHYYPYGDLPGGFMVVPIGATVPVRLTLDRPLLGSATVLE